jgi:hypothetical protein
VICIEFNGKPFDPDAFEDSVLAAALQSVAAQMRDRVGGIRDPNTGEFPTIVVRATSLSDIRLHIEGSDALIARVRKELGMEDASTPAPGSAGSVHEITPKVFLSYASEDRALAGEIVQQLMAHGVDTWWDQWEIRTGDSIRQKIDAGLSGCTHFLVLLTPVSITKTWVNQEMDAGLMRMLDGQLVFLPIRAGLEAKDLPPLLRGRHSPEIRDTPKSVQQLIHDIHGVTRKPPLGSPPAVVSAPANSFSPAATMLARVFVQRTNHAALMDPQFSKDELASLTGLSREDLTDAIYELRGLIEVHEYSGGGYVIAKPELYADFDALWNPWDPAKDALQLAADLHNDPAFPSEPEAIAQRYSWAARRLNPALAYLTARGIVEVQSSLSDGTYLGWCVRATDATRRFVKSRIDK